MRTVAALGRRSGMCAGIIRRAVLEATYGRRVWIACRPNDAERLQSLARAMAEAAGADPMLITASFTASQSVAAL